MHRIGALPTLLLALMACYPGTLTDADDADLVATFPDRDIDFGTIGTYALPDTVVHVGIEASDAISLAHAGDDHALAQLRASLADIGYLEQLDPATTPPDVVVLLSATLSEQVQAHTAYLWWDSWGWYEGWGCCGPDWGFAYPAYVPPVQYLPGTLLIEMVDLRSADQDARQLPVIWSAAINGTMRGPAAGLASRIRSGITQAFAQSPYLGR